MTFTFPATPMRIVLQTPRSITWNPREVQILSLLQERVNVIEALSKINKRNIEFHNGERDALDAEIKEPHHRDQICTAEVNFRNLMRKQCVHEFLLENPMGICFRQEFHCN